MLPDFAQVYGFIGSVFDPNVTGHLQQLKKMDPIDIETVWSQKKYFTFFISFLENVKYAFIHSFVIYLMFLHMTSDIGVIVDEKPLCQFGQSYFRGACKF